MFTYNLLIKAKNYFIGDESKFDSPRSTAIDFEDHAFEVKKNHEEKFYSGVIQNLYEEGGVILCDDETEVSFSDTSVNFNIGSKVQGTASRETSDHIWKALTLIASGEIEWGESGESQDFVIGKICKVLDEKFTVQSEEMIEFGLESIQCDHPFVIGEWKNIS